MHALYTPHSVMCCHIMCHSGRFVAVFDAVVSVVYLYLLLGLLCINAKVYMKEMGGNDAEEITVTLQYLE